MSVKTRGVIIFSVFLVIFYSLFFFTKLSIAGGDYGSCLCTVISVYDGDTFRCNIDSYQPIIGKNIGIRVGGIDTPEINDKRESIRAIATYAKLYLESRLLTAETVELRNMRRGKYFRIVADVYVDGCNISKELISLGLAREYYGGTKVEW